MTGAEDLEPYRRELTGYCYRMLGSIAEAEDAVQDTMVRAWRALPRFEDRAGLRPWLYRIATNVCLDLLKRRSRRALPMDLGPASTGEVHPGAARPGSGWIQPAPDRLVLPLDADPADRAVARESVRLALIAALQRLGARQRAVLILRDVLRWHAAEVADLLETSTDAVNSTLRRARAALGDVDRDAAPDRAGEADRALLDAYVSAFERNDLDSLVGLLREDAIVEMPPFELWLQGRDDVRRFLVGVDACHGEVAVPIAANGSAAVAVYKRRDDGASAAFAIHVLDVVDGRISALHAFLDTGLFATFGLPLELDS
jgi:RNA polymerase sigma-70 factor (ECF subfamily)